VQRRRYPAPVKSDILTLPSAMLQKKLDQADPIAGGAVLRVDPATGQSETWADIQPQDPAGIMTLDLSSLMVTPDGRGYGYSWYRAMSDLYLVEGIEPLRAAPRPRLRSISSSRARRRRGAPSRSRRYATVD
jgi:hypothetical protein